MIKITKEQLFDGLYMSYHTSAMDDNEFFKVRNSFLSKIDDSVETAKEKLVNMVCKKISGQPTPVVVLHSGGVDSTFMLLMARDCYEEKDIRTVTIGFDEKEFDERNKVREICKRLWTTDNWKRIEYIVYKEFMEYYLSKIDKNNYLDWFYSSSLIPTFTAFDIAKDHGNTIITGDGGDELFCGYDRYLFAYYFPFSWLMILRDKRKEKGKRFRKYGYEGLVSIWDYEILSKLLGFCGGYNNIFKNIKDEVNFTHMNCLEGLMLTDIATELNGVELLKVETARRMTGYINTISPFLDAKIRNYCCSLPIDYKYRSFTRKWLLREIIKDRLPEYDKISKKKKGFGMPIGKWLSEYILDDFTSEYFNQKEVAKIWTEHKKGLVDHSERLFGLFMFNVLRNKGILEVV